MLYSIFPIALVAAAIDPVHLSVTVPEVSSVVALIEVSVCPCEDAITPLLIRLVLPLVFVAVPGPPFPQALPGPESVLEVPFEVAFVLPIVLTETPRPVVLVKPLINVSIHELLDPLSVLHRVLELPLVPVALFIHEYPVAFQLPLVPLPNVSLSSAALPETLPLLNSTRPLPLVSLPLPIGELSPSFGFVLLVEAVIDRPIHQPLKAQPVLLIVLPLPLENSLFLLVFIE